MQVYCDLSLETRIKAVLITLELMMLDAGEVLRRLSLRTRDRPLLSIVEAECIRTKSKFEEALAVSKTAKLTEEFVDSFEQRYRETR